MMTKRMIATSNSGCKLGGTAFKVACMALGLLYGPAQAAQYDLQQELNAAARIVGPENTEDDCASCHSLEHEAWQQTRHYATFKDRHRSDEAKQILAALGQKSMKRQGLCRQCHYTSVLKNDKPRPAWGVSCESCHGPAADWLEIHHRPGGELTADALQWGDGKTEPEPQRSHRLAAAKAKGMINSQMTYEIAANCFACHTVPDEALVNTGGHHPGKAFELVAHSQGEVRHNFVSSNGAPDNPQNQAANQPQLRRLYVAGLMVDLEYTLRNLASVEESGAAFHTAMIERANRLRAASDTLFATVNLPNLAAAVALIPSPVVVSTVIDANLASKLQAAVQQFLQVNDGSELAGLDGLLPEEHVGEPYLP